MNKIDKYFKISKRKSTIKKELMAGLIIFISMFYIVAIQGSFIGESLANESGMSNVISSSTIGIITAFSAAISSIFLGFYANLPIALASGMGVNAFVAFTMMGPMGMSFSESMSAILISGLLFVLISITPARTRILESIPDNLKKAISIGVGLFLMFVALSNTGIIGDLSDDPFAGTPTFLGDFSNPVVVLALISILLTIIFWLFDIKGGVLFVMIISILIGFVFYAITNNPELPTWEMDWNNYGESFKGLQNTIGKAFIGFSNTKSTFANPEWYLAIFVLFLNDFFDTAGTLFGVNNALNSIEKSELENSKFKSEYNDIKINNRVLIVDAISTTIGSIFGATNVTIFAESNAGINYGGRTGLTAITTGILFIISIPIIPLLTPLFTYSVTAGAIFMIGIMMASLLKEINIEDKVYLVSSIFIIMFMILGYSIGTGIVIGLLVFILLMLVTGRIKELDWILIASSPLFLAFIILPLVI